MSDTFLPGSGFDTYEQQDKVQQGGVLSAGFLHGPVAGDGRCGASVHR